MANETKNEMAITPKGLKLLLAGASDDRLVFSYAIFDFQRLVAAPLVIIAGIVIEVVAIMGWTIPRKKK